MHFFCILYTLNVMVLKLCIQILPVVIEFTYVDF